MANNKVSVNNIAISLNKTLAEFREETAVAFKKDVKKAAKFCVQELKAKSPNETEEYASGWKSRVESESPSRISVVVYNSKKPQITHLLENRHVKVSPKTKKVLGTVKAYPHIAPARNATEKKLNQDIERDIFNGK